MGTIESLGSEHGPARNACRSTPYDKRLRIYACNPGMPPHYIADGAKVVNWA